MPQHRGDQLGVPLPRPASDAPGVTTARIPVLNVASADRLCRLQRVRNVCQNAIIAIDAALDRQGDTG
ncbi:hypothetical protein ACIBF7_44290 [Nonomuraea sp. NPDC050478]|uniref:hypothetical protein n=1 Tax=Nonomuraea sp. NPDC050478 TaxID=3364365 RepID=UPI0037A2E3CD